MINAIIVAASLLIVIGCGSDQTASDTAPAQRSSQTAQVKPYPVDWCIVTGEKLGSMGDPITKNYQGQEVKFCCKYCIPEFEKTPATFLAMIDSAATGLLKQPEHGGTH